LERRGHGASLKCITDVVLHRISRDDFEAMLKSQEHLARQLLRSLSVKLQVVRRDFVELDLQSKAIRQHLKGGTVKSSQFRVAVFDVKPFWRPVFAKLASEFPEINISLKEPKLTEETVYLAAGHDAVCCFVNDTVNKTILNILNQLGVRMVLMRCAGFNNVDLKVCDQLGISVARVPAYSPYAVAEHAAALTLTLNRKIHSAYHRVRDGNFTLQGLVGFDMHGKTIGIAGTGKIGMCFMSIAAGFGCKLLCYDVFQNPEVKKYGAKYTTMDDLLANSDVVSLHLPLLKETHRVINKKSLAKMKKGALLINTSRGGLVNTTDLIEALKSGHLGGAGLDVFENESAYFFEDWSDKAIRDDELSRLLTFNNVIITSHQAFLTDEALTNICSTTLNNAREFIKGKRMNELTNTLNGVDRFLQVPPKKAKL
jgi:D-lactate dehydrogenase